MSRQLIIHPATDRQLQAFIASPAHFVVVIGPAGSGKYSLAVETAQKVLDVSNLQDYPYAKTISSQDGKAIGIEQVRGIERFISLKVPGAASEGYNRAVIIEDGHKLTNEAQNALLKTLEEPPAATMFIMTASHDQALLPTIRSRATFIYVNQPDQAALKGYFQDTDPKLFQTAYGISGGLPGLMSALINSEDHPLKEATEQARQLLSDTAYQRLLAVEALSKNRQLAMDTAFILQQMARAALKNSAGKTNTRWQKVLQSGYEAAEALNNNAQPKLVLDNLMLSF
jgi:hypothetical protein